MLLEGLRKHISPSCPTSLFTVGSFPCPEVTSAHAQGVPGAQRVQELGAGENIILASSLFSQMQESRNGGRVPVAQSPAFTWPSISTSLPTHGIFSLAQSVYASGTCFVGHNGICGPLTLLFSLNLQKSGKIYRKWTFKDIECSHLVFLY